MTTTRRNFIQRAAFAPILLGINYQPAIALPFYGIFDKPSRPVRLSKGDTIGLISPSGAIFNSEPIDIAIEALERFGLKVKAGKYLKSRYGHLAGTDEERAWELNEMFANDNVKAIICIRGGSGASRILSKIDYSLIRSNPKIFVGYSDITALQLAIYKKTGLVTFHGPVGISSWDQFSRDYFVRLLFNNELIQYENPTKPESDWVQTENRIRTIHPGTAKGKLIGGNLTVLCSLLGSDYLPNFKGAILFLEEIDEELYKIDRLFSQLQLSGILKNIKGFVFGKCTNCKPAPGYGSLTFEEITDHYIKPLRVPAFNGSMIGHVKSKFTLPVGAEVEINADKGTIKLQEHVLDD